MPDLSGVAAEARVVLLGRSGFFAAVLAERLHPLFVVSRLRVVGSAEPRSLRSATAAVRLRRGMVDENTTLIVSARVPRGSDPFGTFIDEDVVIATAIAPGCRRHPAERLRLLQFQRRLRRLGERLGDHRTYASGPDIALRHIQNRCGGCPSPRRSAGRRPAVRSPPVHGLRARRYVLSLWPRAVRALRFAGRQSSGVRGRQGKCATTCSWLTSRDTTLALAFGGTPGTYNLATGTSYSFQQLLACLRDLVGQFEVETVPRDRPTTDQGFDTSRLRAALPDLRLTSLREGLAETVAGWAVPTGRS